MHKTKNYFFEMKNLFMKKLPREKLIMGKKPKKVRYSKFKLKIDIQPQMPRYKIISF
jgi:hypothetical protein